MDDEGKGEICHLFPISNQVVEQYTIKAMISKNTLKVSGGTAKRQQPRKFKKTSKTKELITRETGGGAQQRRRSLQEIFQKGISDLDTLPWVGVKI